MIIDSEPVIVASTHQRRVAAACAGRGTALIYATAGGAVSASERLTAPSTSRIGSAQLKIRVARWVSSEPGVMGSGAIAAEAAPHMAVRRRLTALKTGEDQEDSGTSSRAYCSVNGTQSSEPNAISASRPAAIPRP